MFMYSYCHVYVFLLLCLCILIVMFMYSYCYVYVFLLSCLCIFIAIFMYSYYVYIFLLICMFCSVYSVSLCCFVYCLCVNVYCTTATGCQPNCSYQIYHIIYRIVSYHIISYIISLHIVSYHIISISIFMKHINLTNFLLCIFKCGSRNNWKSVTSSLKVHSVPSCDACTVPLRVLNGTRLWSKFGERPTQYCQNRYNFLITVRLTMNVIIPLGLSIFIKAYNY